MSVCTSLLPTTGLPLPLFSAGGSGTGDFVYAELDEKTAAEFKSRGPFVNRGLQEWYYIDDKSFGGRAKGGTVDFLLSHPNPIGRAMREKWGEFKKSAYWH